MNRNIKKGLAAAALLIALGLLIFAAAMTVCGWDFSRLSAVSYTTNVHEIDESFTDITVQADTADVTFMPASDGRCRVVCQEPTDRPHTVTVQDGMLTVTAQDIWQGNNFIGIDWHQPTIAVYLPQTVYGVLSTRTSTGDITLPQDFRFDSIQLTVSTGDISCRASAADTVRLEAGTGDICAEDLTAAGLELSVSTGVITANGVDCTGDVQITVSTGDATLTDVRCQNLLTDGSTGDLRLQNVYAAGRFSVERSTGDVIFDGSDAAELLIKTSTGDVTGILLTGKKFITETNTGTVDVPEDADGGLCKISTDTGDIGLKIQ